MRYHAIQWFGGLIGCLLLGCGASPVSAQNGGTANAHIQIQVPDGQGGSGSWLGGAPMHTQVVVGDDGDTYVGVWIDAPDHAPKVAERAPMAVSLVVDTSGSMSGEKIANARMAAASLIESLQDGDLVSIYGFSDGVREVAPPTVVSPSTRSGLMARVNGLYASGGTNLYGGLNAAISRMAQVSAEEPIRRVVLISDGHANIGPSDPISLGNVAARGTEWNIQVTAIGVGLDYDETTLGALAVRSAGRMYHLSDPSQMATILDQELHLLAQTVATDAYMELVPAPGVQILGSATPGVDVQGNKVRVKLGSVHAGQEREVLLRAKLDTTKLGAHPVGVARLVYRKPSAHGAGAPVVQQARLSYRVTRSRTAAAKSEAPRVAAMVATQQAAQAQFRAAQLLNRGQGAAAAAQLDQAQRQLRSAAKSAPAPVRRRLMKQARSVGGAAHRAARASTPAAARGAALEVNDMAMDAEGY